MVKRFKAFTLIELLVVIAIVGILTAFIFVSMNNAINSSKDVKRMADIESFSKSLLAYQASGNALPPSVNSCSSNCASCTIGSGGTCPAAVTTALQTILPGNNLPTDPNGTLYTYQSNGTGDCVLTATLSTGQIYTYTCGVGFAKSAGSGSSANSDGACSVASGTINLNTQSCSGRGTADAVNFSSTVNTTSGSNQIILSSTPTGLTAGDQVLIINLQGTSGNYSNVGQYETKIISNINSNTLTFTQSLANSYDGTTQKIMVQRLPNYSTVTISTGAILTANSWDGTKGGVLAFYSNGSATVNGLITMTGKGYAGGVGGANGCSNYPWPTTAGDRGESYNGNNSVANCNRRASVLGNFVAVTPSAGAGGGGGGSTSANPRNGGGGGGGSYGTQGGAGTNSCSGENGAQPGVIYGSTTLSQIYLGSGGGGGGRGVNATGGNGGTGGGIVFVNLGTSATISGSGTVVADGGAAGAAASSDDGGGGGGGGAGGSILITGGTYNILSLSSVGGAKTNGTGGANGVCSPAGNGGVGGSGIIYIGSTIVSYCASGGGLTCTETANGSDVIDTYTYNSSPGTTTWTVPAGVTSVQYLVVAGGGGGAASRGGGGGAGGFLTGTGFAVSGSVSITVGAGGAGGVGIGYNTPSANGGNSIFGSVTAIGGGGGGTSGTAGKTGGSGGGGAYGYTYGAGTAGQGYSGGNYYNSGNNYGAGGGGGAGAVGNTGTSTGGGAGGVGLSSSITGTAIYYAGGGGGGQYPAGSGNTGGTGGGGNGGYGAGAGAAGTNGLGAGGGGSGDSMSATTYGGAGGSGVVIIRYAHP